MRTTKQKIFADSTFAVFRLINLTGGFVWAFFLPARPEGPIPLAWLAVAFVVYNLLLHGLILWRPAWSEALFLWGLTVDLLFVFFLAQYTGGVMSQFFLVFFALIALNALHFGLAVGGSAALAASVLYVISFFEQFNPVHWTHFALHLSLFLSSGLGIGLLSEREKRQRRRVEELNRELEKALQNLRETQDRLINSEKMAAVGQLSTKVAHEIRNPLTSMSLNLELLEDELRESTDGLQGETKTLLSSIRSQIEILTALTEDYLRFSRLPRFNPEPGSLAKALEDIVRFTKAEFDSRKIQVIHEWSQTPPTLLLDSRQIRLAFLNLLRNAWEAMPTGGTLTIRGEPNGSRVHVSVSDSGPGIVERNREKIFTPFFTTKEDGTGLGLTLVRQIAEAHGGNISCHSSPQGTTFTISLPVVPERNET